MVQANTFASPTYFAIAVIGWTALIAAPPTTNAFSVLPWSTISTSSTSPSTNANTLLRRHHHHHHHPQTPTPTSLFVTSKESSASTSTSTTTPSVVSKESGPLATTSASTAEQQQQQSLTKKQSPQQQKQTMDQGIFDFNKKLIDTVYDIVCFLYPVKGTERDYARFYVLETVARVPYFAYLSVLHLKETFGDRAKGDRMRTHYAQADNELHHLLIMEEMGGNSQWLDRTLAQTMAFGYYWYVILMYLWKEPAAYHLSELIEYHAFETYDNFLTEYGDQLQTMPVPKIAQKYYELDNPFLFDLFCTVRDDVDTTSSGGGGGGGDGFSVRRPKLETLYDVFVNIRDDEREHWKTLCNLVQYDDMNAVAASQVRSTEPTSTTASTSS
mmetsp:Transcript_121535/g.340351  ORF Transcript_121535/g.340351 Transcript_121535/m.340351 type:complete len:385 (-) Transcript_121535:31-1185(-)